METGGQAPRKSVIPAQAGIQGLSTGMDSRLRGNDGLKKTIHLIFVRNQNDEDSRRAVSGPGDVGLGRRGVYGPGGIGVEAFALGHGVLGTARPPDAGVPPAFPGCAVWNAGLPGGVPGLFAA